MDMSAYIYNGTFNPSNQINIFAIHADYQSYDSILTTLLKQEVELRRPIWGGIALRVDGTEFIYEDEVVPLVQGFCLEELPDLIAGNPSYVIGYGHQGSVALIPRQTTIAIYPDYEYSIVTGEKDWPMVEPTLAVPKDQFIDNILNISECFVDVWRQLSSTHPQHIGLQQEVQELSILMKEARVAVNDSK